MVFSFILNLKPVFFYQTLHLLFICVGLYIFIETIASECSTFRRASNMYGFLYACAQGPTVDPETVYIYFLVGSSELNEPSTWRLALDFTSSYLFSPSYTHLTWCNFICEHSVITETTVKQRPLVFIWFDIHWETPGYVGFSKLSLMWKTLTSSLVIGTRDTEVCYTSKLALCIQVLLVCSPTGRVMDRERVYEIPGLSDQSCIN